MNLVNNRLVSETQDEQAHLFFKRPTLVTTTSFCAHNCHKWQRLLGSICLRHLLPKFKQGCRWQRNRQKFSVSSWSYFGLSKILNRQERNCLVTAYQDHTLVMSSTVIVRSLSELRGPRGPDVMTSCQRLLKEAHRTQRRLPNNDITQPVKVTCLVFLSILHHASLHSISFRRQTSSFSTSLCCQEPDKQVPCSGPPTCSMPCPFPSIVPS